LSKHVKRGFCVCDKCARETAKKHAAADRACGREWTCQCGACRRTRVLSAKAVKEIEAGLKRIRETEQRLAALRSLR
jgi:hypothetical protein